MATPRPVLEQLTPTILIRIEEVKARTEVCHLRLESKNKSFHRRYGPVDGPVTHFIYSHWHADHVGAVAVFGPNVKHYGH